MTTIQNFTQTIRQTENLGGYLDVNTQGALEVKGTGFFGRIASWFRGSGEIAATNQRVMEAFVGKLRQEYGNDFVDQLPAQLIHTPLSSRLATQLHEAGLQHQMQFRDLNQIKINELSHKTDTFSQIFNDSAKNQGFNIPLNDLNSDSLLGKIGRAIEEAGHNNAHVVSTSEAYALTEKLVGRFIESKMTLLSEIDKMKTIPEADRAMLRELAMNNDMTPEILKMLGQNYGQAADFMRTILSSKSLDVPKLLNGLGGLEKNVLDSNAAKENIDIAPLELLMKTGLAFANRDHGVQPDAILSQLSSSAGQNLRAALSMFMDLDDPEIMSVMGARSVQLEQLREVVGKACGLSDEQIDTRDGLPAFDSLKQMPEQLATELSDSLGFNLPRPSGLNASGAGIFSQVFQGKVIESANNMLAKYVSDESRFEGNVDKQFIKDAERSFKYSFNNQFYEGKKDIEKLKSDLNKNFTDQEVKILTSISHQGMDASFFTSIPEGLGPFSGMPVQSNTGGSGSEYAFSKDEAGNLVVDVKGKVRVDYLDELSGRSPVKLDAESSYYSYSFSLKITADSIKNGKPQCELMGSMNYDYAFNDFQEKKNQEVE